MKSDLVDLEICVHHATDKAVLISLDGDRSKAVWIPRSVAEVTVKRGVTGEGNITLPERVAIDKGLL